MGLILLIVLLLLLFGSSPAFPYARGWGYRPMGLWSLLLIIIVVLVLFDVLSLGFGLSHPWQRPVVQQYRFPNLPGGDGTFVQRFRPFFGNPLNPAEITAWRLCESGTLKREFCRRWRCARRWLRRLLCSSRPCRETPPE